MTGGRTFGYDNVAVEGPGGTRSHVTRRINDAEAVVVRRIFALCAQGLGYKRIADALNADGIPSPPPRGTGRIQAWAASTVREVLARPLYRGEVVWNQRRKRDRWGQKRYERRPESEWIRQEAPGLRIVSEAEWQAAHARLDSTRGAYLRHNNGQIWSRPARGIESRFLLSGFLSCGLCGSSMTVTSRDWKSHRHFAYACSYNRFRGRSVCGNGLWAPMEAADREVLGDLDAKLFAPEAVEAGLRLALAELQPSEDTAEARLAALRAELATVEGERARYAAAIAAGVEPDAIAPELNARRERAERLRKQIAALEGRARPSPAGSHQLEAELRSYLADWRGLLRGQPIQARQMVRKTLEGRLVFMPEEDDDGRRYRFSGPAGIERLVLATPVAKKVVTPGGSARRGRRDAESDTPSASAWNLVVDLATTIIVDAA